MNILRVNFVFFIFIFLPVFLYAQQSGISICEMMVNPEGTDTDHEWIEVINNGSPLSVLTGKTGWRLNDGKNHYINGEAFTWDLGEVIIFAQDSNIFRNQYPLVKIRILESPFSLKNTNGSIQLIDTQKNVRASVTYANNADEGLSIILQNGEFKQGSKKGGNPGSCNDIVYQATEIQSTNIPSLQAHVSLSTSSSQQTSSQGTSTQSIATSTQKILPAIFISEFLPNNKGADENEFIELFSTSTHSFVLDGYILQVGSKRIKLSGEFLGPYMVFHKEDYGFSIRNAGETISLLHDNAVVHKISYSGKAPEDASFAKISDEWKWTKPTPGSVNVYRTVALSNKITNQSKGNMTQTANASDAIENLTPLQASVSHSALHIVPLLLGIVISVCAAGAVLFLLK